MEFNQKVFCKEHPKNFCTLLCIHHDCKKRALCKDCVKNHNESHLASVIPMSKNNLVVPKLYINQLADIKASTMKVKDSIATSRVDMVAQMHEFFKQFNVVLMRKAEEFKKRSMEYVEDFYNTLHPKLMNLLFTLEKELREVEDLSNTEFLNSETIQMLLGKQNRLKEAIIPNLNAEMKLLNEELKNIGLYFKKDRAFKILSKGLDHLFKVDYLYSVKIYHNNDQLTPELKDYDK